MFTRYTRHVCEWVLYIRASIVEIQITNPNTNTNKHTWKHTPNRVCECTRVIKCEYTLSPPSPPLSPSPPHSPPPLIYICMNIYCAPYELWWSKRTRFPPSQPIDERPEWKETLQHWRLRDSHTSFEKSIEKHIDRANNELFLKLLERSCLPNDLYLKLYLWLPWTYQLMACVGLCATKTNLSSNSLAARGVVFAFTIARDEMLFLNKYKQH